MLFSKGSPAISKNLRPVTAKTSLENTNIKPLMCFVTTQQTVGGGQCSRGDWTVRLNSSLTGAITKLVFGNLNGEFWVGLVKIHRLTSDNNIMLRVDLEDFEGNTTYAEYNMLGVLSENDKYKLLLGSYSGNSVRFLKILWVKTIARIAESLRSEFINNLGTNQNRLLITRSQLFKMRHSH